MIFKSLLENLQVINFLNKLENKYDCSTQMGYYPAYLNLLKSWSMTRIDNCYRMIEKTIDCNFVFRSLKTIVLFSEKRMVHNKRTTCLEFLKTKTKQGYNYCWNKFCKKTNKFFNNKLIFF